MRKSDLSDGYLADALFFDLVGLAGLPAKGSLEGASGSKSDPGPYATSLVERVETAWRTLYAELTCEQVRLLLSQRMGLRWLARPILEFVELYPAVTVMNYPGEMVLLAFAAADELAAAAPEEFAQWIRRDFDWLEEVFGWSRPILREARAGLEKARAL